MEHNLISIIFIGDKDADYQKLVKWAYGNLHNSEVLELRYTDYLILKDNLILEIISDTCNLFGLIEGEDDAIYEKGLQVKLLLELEEHYKQIQKGAAKEWLEKIIQLLKKAISNNKVMIFFFL